MATAKFREIQFSDANVVNKEDFIPEGEYNPHRVRPWLLHDHGFVLAIVFASSLQDALDTAVDEGVLDRYEIDPTNEKEREDYMVKDVVPPGSDPNCPDFMDKDGGKWWWQEGKEPAYLGNAGEPFDIESLQYEELPNPPFSFVALFNAGCLS